jgi:hypothetical protein
VSDEVEFHRRTKKRYDRYGSKVLKTATSQAVLLLKKTPAIADDDLFRSLKLVGPHLSESDYLKAITNAKSLLLKPEFLTPEIKKEMNEWDRLEN